MEERWSFLSPWCQMLRGRLDCRSPFNTLSSWNTPNTLDVQMPRRSDSDTDTEKQFRAKFTKTREAMALLAAVRYVDYDAWVHLLGKQCGADVGRDGEQKLENIPVKYEVMMDLSVRVDPENPDKTVFDLVRLCGVDQRENASPEYLAALKRIAEMRESAQGNLVDLRIPIQVLAEDDTMEFLADMVDAARAERLIKQEWEEYSAREGLEPGLLRCTFVVEPMIISLEDRGIHGVSPEFTETLEYLLANNVWISKLDYSAEMERLNEIEHDERAYRKSVGQLMRSALACTRISREAANMGYYLDDERSLDPFQLDVVCLCAGDDLPKSFVEGMFSAIPFSQATRCLYLDFAAVDIPDDMRFLSKWLAYGVFSQLALGNSAWETLHLQLNQLAIEDAGDFAMILNAEHPEEELCGRPRGLKGERNATLRCAAPIRWDFNDDGEADLTSPLTVPVAIDFVRIFSDDGISQWIDAIVPGFGRCQVRRGDLSFHQRCVAKAKDVSDSRKSLIVHFCEGATDGLPVFLKAIGGLLKSLKLAGPRDPLDDTVIYQHCPNLEELSLCGGLSDVELNFSEYRASGGSLSELTSTNWHDISVLSTALCSIENPIAKCVRKLRVRLKRQTDGWTEIHHAYEPRGFEADLQPFLQILETNQNLEYFEIIVLSEYERHLGDFRQYHLKPIAQTREPISMSCKLALLSVFSPQSRSTGSDPKKSRGTSRQFQFDNLEPTQDALSSIFAFAGLPVLRQVYFRTRLYHLESDFLD